MPGGNNFLNITGLYQRRSIKKILIKLHEAIGWDHG
jgi:hypothetical protein